MSRHSQATIRWRSLGAALFYAFFSSSCRHDWLPPFQRIFGGTFQISVEFYKFIFFSVFLFALISFSIRYGGLRIFSRQKQLVPPRARPKDTAFHLFALTGVLFLILIPRAMKPYIICLAVLTLPIRDCRFWRSSHSVPCFRSIWQSLKSLPIFNQNRTGASRVLYLASNNCFIGWSRICGLRAFS